MRTRSSHTPEGSEIEVVAEQHRFSISLQVRDRGPGIPEDELGKIFDLFHRVRQGDRNRAGTGLGLRIVQTIIDKHAGDVMIESTEGKGTTVFIRLRLHGYGGLRVAEEPTGT